MNVCNTVNARPEKHFTHRDFSFPDMLDIAGIFL